MYKLTKIFRITLIFIWTFGLGGPVGLIQDLQASRAHPILVQLAIEQPDQPIAVIVQKLAGDSQVEARVAKLGGVITKDLSIINAFAVEMQAQAALALSRDPGVRWVSLDAGIESTGKPSQPKDGSLPASYYLDTLGVRQVWNLGYQGAGVAVAVIDSGLTADEQEFRVNDKKPFTRVKAYVTINPAASGSDDTTGHGTHVTGVLGANGAYSNGLYAGIAPLVDLISLKVSDDAGRAYESDVVAAMQWVYDHKSAYNIRVVNLSIQSTVEQSYHNSPMAAAAEILWFNGVVVVAAAGNYMSGSNYNPANAAPANDPFIITVGAADEHATSEPSDDTIASFSAWTMTSDGYLKPDVFAPGKDIINVLAGSSSWGTLYPERVIGGGQYIRLSGSSMAAPMVSGAIALLLQKEPNLTPDQVKFRLLATSRYLHINNANGQMALFPYIDVYKALTTSTTKSANTGLTASQLLWTGSNPITWGSVAWNSVAWNSVAWNSVAWNSVAWNSVAWNSVSWND